MRTRIGVEMHQADKGICELAIHGGIPIRGTLLPYGHQMIDEDDLQAVVEALRSDWITTGPKVVEFEEAFAAYVGSSYAVSFSSGTAALHGAAFAAGLKPGDEAITTPMTFCATANCILYCGVNPVFADISPDTMNINPEEVARHISERTKAIIPVDYAGHPAELDAIMELAERNRLIVIEDACHALGASYKGKRVGSISHMTIFSFHPVKNITTGEGGMVVTDDREFARRLRLFRNHGITTDHHQRELQGSWFYEMIELGYNYRLTDIQCALGLSQLRKLPKWIKRRQEIAEKYNDAFAKHSVIRPQSVRVGASHAYHLYVVQLDLKRLHATRAEIFSALRAEGIGVNVHYIPVHLHPYYRKRFGYTGGEYPVAEKAYEQIISLPIFPAMTDKDIEDVILAMDKVLAAYAE